MSNKINWQRLQVSMNNFKINQLMSFTDVKNKLGHAFKNADQSSKLYKNAKEINQLIPKLNHHDDFIQDNSNNQKLFKQVQKLINPLVGYAKVEDPITKQLNHLFKQAKAKNPKAMKQFNRNAHKQSHMSAQQAMLQVMGQETKRENSKK